MKKILYFCLIMLHFSIISEAQNALKMTKNDTIIAIKSPILTKQSLLFSTNSLGGQIGVGKLLKQRETHRFTKSGQERIKTKSRALYATLGYYYQPDFQHNWSLAAEYAMSRVNRKGLYSEFAPFLGVSRTFLTATSYSVSDNGVVTKDNLAGNWYVTGGFSTGLGKHFETPKWGSLETVSAKFVLQTFYPNFKFIAIKPYFQVQTTWELPKFETNAQKMIKFKS
ncbi:MAG: hypothetical protein U5L45_18455 [Saprospiraceae bacterium]|nr:hypothetical protein [Saprospiraceae bacterium]